MLRIRPVCEHHPPPIPDHRDIVSFNYTYFPAQRTIVLPQARAETYQLNSGFLSLYTTLDVSNPLGR